MFTVGKGDDSDVNRDRHKKTAFELHGRSNTLDHRTARGYPGVSGGIRGYPGVCSRWRGASGPRFYRSLSVVRASDLVSVRNSGSSLVRLSAKDGVCVVVASGVSGLACVYGGASAGGVVALTPTSTFQ